MITHEDNLRQNESQVEDGRHERSKHLSPYEPFRDFLSLQQSVGNRAMNALMQGALPPVASALINSGKGERIEPELREQMESRFGRDFDDVRVHTNREAANSAEAVQAKAYTVGTHIIFGEGRYAPDTREGAQLFAHELAHVVQQSRGGPAAKTSASQRALEQSADHAAASVVHGSSSVQVSGASAPALARQPLSDLIQEFGPEVTQELITFWQGKIAEENNPTVRARYQRYVANLQNGTPLSPDEAGLKSEEEMRYIYRKVGSANEAAYKSGRSSPRGGPASKGATKPDIALTPGDIEVKARDITDPKNASTVIREIRRQVAERQVGGRAHASRQGVILDLRGQNVTEAQIESVVNQLTTPTQVSVPGEPNPVTVSVARQNIQVVVNRGQLPTHGPGSAGPPPTGGGTGEGPQTPQQAPPGTKPAATTSTTPTTGEGASPAPAGKSAAAGSSGSATGATSSAAQKPTTQSAQSTGKTPSPASKPTDAGAAEAGAGSAAASKGTQTTSKGAGAGKPGPPSSGAKAGMSRFVRFRGGAGRLGSGLAGLAKQQLFEYALDVATGGLLIADAEEERAVKAIAEKMNGSEVQGLINEKLKAERLNIARKQAKGEKVFIAVQVKLLFTDRYFDGFSKFAPRVWLTNKDESDDTRIPYHDLFVTRYERYVVIGWELSESDVELSEVERLRIRVDTLKEMIKSEEAVSSGYSTVHRKELGQAQWELRRAEREERKQQGQKRRAEEQQRKDEEEKRKSIAAMTPLQTPAPPQKPLEPLPQPGTRKEDQTPAWTNPDMAKLMGRRDMTDKDKVTLLSGVFEAEKAKLVAATNALKAKSSRTTDEMNDHQSAVKAFIGALDYAIDQWKEYSEKPGGVGWENLREWEGMKRLRALRDWVEQSDGKNALMR